MIFRELRPDEYDLLKAFLYEAIFVAEGETPPDHSIIERPEYVIPYLAQLKQIAQTDENQVVRIHCLGAVRAAETEIYDFDEDIHDPCLRFQR